MQTHDNNPADPNSERLDHLADTNRMRAVTDFSPDYAGGYVGDYERAGNAADAVYAYEENESYSSHLDDTSRIQPIEERGRGRGGRAVGLMMLLGAFGFMVATAVLLTLPQNTPEQIAVTEVGLPINSESSLVGSGGEAGTGETGDVQVAPPVADNAGESVAANVIAPPLLPTANPETLQALLQQPVLSDSNTGEVVLARNLNDPFTIIPDRARTEIIQYEVVSGDTFYTLAERFGIKPESIAWSNDRSAINGGLRPGRILNIPPVDGVLHTVPNQQTIQEIADIYNVTPFAIIDSEFNDLYGATPDTTLPSGTQVMVPGGTAESINWNPVVQRIPAEGGGGQNSGGGQIVFAPGDPGSCGLVDNPGGSGGWTNPLGGGYQWMQGYSGFHTGVDLSKPAGAPVFAANGGTVVFAGWNTGGYGYLVVLAHGAFTTVYGHLSAISVGCGAYVNAGQVIGAVGSTGNSSGDHLHFEVRYNDVPQDPTTVMPL